MNASIEHNEIFDLAFRFITETAENIFLTGKAGTGKTTFLKYLRNNSSKNMVVAAPTGVAAINAGGVTLHSLFGLPFHPFIPTRAGKDELLKKLRFNKQKLQLLRKTELLVIDEISMVRADVLDSIDHILRSVRGNYQAPFGGMQLLFIGDLHQLPPVAQNHEWNILKQYYPSPFFFDSLAVKEQQPLLLELTKIYRQKEQGFIDLLNNVRTNNMSAEDFDMLNSRFIPYFSAHDDEKFITLTSHNAQADQINNRELNKLPGAPQTYNAEIEGEFPETQFPADGVLTLKKDAQVMFLKNDVIGKRYFNGKIGTVHSLEEEKIIVKADDDLIEVYPETWENTKYTLSREDGKLEQNITGSFTQFPLRQAWAITIHKSQGLTFDKLMIDAASAFSGGQVYVALSRCTSLEGIVLLSKIPPSAVYASSNVAEGQQSLTHKGNLAERFAGARQLFTLQLLEDLFLFREISTAFDALQAAVSFHREKFSEEAVSWTAGLFTKFKADQLLGEKFIRQAAGLLKENSIIENNRALQERIGAAVDFFLPKIREYSVELKNQPLITESKETADAVDECLQDLAAQIHFAEAMLNSATTGFAVKSFLKSRLDYAKPRITISSYAKGKTSTPADAVNGEMYSILRKWRDAVAEKLDKPLFFIAANAMLKDIADLLPQNKVELKKIKGFGSIKVESYGDEICELVAEFCERTGAVGKIIAEPEKEKKKTVKAVKVADKIPSVDITLELLKKNLSVAEIAGERNLSTGTVEGHLLKLIEEKRADIFEIMDREKYDRILPHIGGPNQKSLTEIKEQLPDDSYGEIRMVIASLK